MPISFFRSGDWPRDLPPTIWEMAYIPERLHCRRAAAACSSDEMLCEVTQYAVPGTVNGRQALISGVSNRVECRKVQLLRRDMHTTVTFESDLHSPPFPVSP